MYSRELGIVLLGVVGGRRQLHSAHSGGGGARRHLPKLNSSFALGMYDMPTGDADTEYASLA